jgi:hypothetical protein
MANKDGVNRLTKGRNSIEGLGQGIYYSVSADMYDCVRVV